MSDGDQQSGPGAGTPGDPETAPAIRALDDDTIRRIAAGEVVERPASVVKELVENSLDADAERVRVAVEAGGTEGVVVRDDGVGMTEPELRLAVQEHTTSKIRDIDDLEAGVGTLGFRGEALHTIGAVSKLSVRSKPRGASGAGTELRVEGGEVTAVEPVGCPEGTTVEVDGLFYNTPARRKFLKTEATEFDHVNTVVTQYALANPDVSVGLTHDDREVFATEGRGSLRSTVLSVYGREVAESMVDVAWTPDGAGDPTGEDGGEAGGDDSTDDAAPIREVRGLVSHPETTRADRSYCSTFVNGRYVTARTLREAVLDAYGGQLAPDRYPFATLFVDVPPDSVDVNVHPRKMEVRFDEETAVRTAVETAVREALLDEGLVRSGAPRGRSAPDETEVVPGGGTDAADGADGAIDAGESTADDDEGAMAGEAGEDETIEVDEGAVTGAGEGTVTGADEGETPDADAETVAGGTGGDDPRADSDGQDGPTDVDVRDGVADAGGPAGSIDWDAVRERAGRSTDATESDATESDATDATESDATESAGSMNATDATDATEERRDDAAQPDAGETADSSPADPPIGSTRGAASDTLDGSSTGPGTDTPGDTGDDATGSTTGSAGESTDDTEPAADAWPDTDRAGAHAHGRDAADAGRGRGSDAGRLRGPTSQRTLDGEEATVDAAFDRLPGLRVLGQYRDTYLVAEAADGLVLIDQHAADERVNYERLREEFRGDTPTQSLAAPVELELTAREAALFEEYRDALAQLGFYAGRTGERTVEVRTVPAVFDDALEPSLLRDVLTAFVGGGTDAEATVDAVADSLLADLACYPSVTGNTSLTEGSVVELLEALDDCENPFACPHGRPTIVRFDGEEIEDRFERDYPGHAGRREE
jgi:DNA mismatch repair protein MutL